MPKHWRGQEQLTLLQPLAADPTPPMHGQLLVHQLLQHPSNTVHRSPLHFSTSFMHQLEGGG